MGEKELRKKYEKKLEAELGSVRLTSPVTSHEFKEFKKELFPVHFSLYEKLCGLSAKILRIKPDKKYAGKVKADASICHLDISPSGSFSFALIASLLVVFFGIILGFGILNSTFVTVLFLFAGLGLFFPLQNLPSLLANSWRLKASNQMIQCVFYVTTYMRHTSNLERALAFATEHISPPLSLDLKKVLWNIETEKFGNIKDSLEDYLITWKRWNLEFIESFHLIEGSLYEGSEARRLDMLDRSLSVLLTETYEKMLRYAHDLQSPITMLHMLGIILPILGLVILPLVASFMTSETTSPGSIALNIAVLYNLFLPFGVFFMGKIVLSKRPTGYGDTDITPVKKVKNFGPLFFAGLFFFVFFIVGVLPWLIFSFNPAFDVQFLQFNFIGGICPSGGDCLPINRVGPYGLGAALLSLLVTVGVGVGAGLYYRLKSKNVIGLRQRTKKLENEFASGLFQLGSRLGDGVPAEIAFEKVSKIMADTPSGEFFSKVSQNISSGMGLEQAIFNPKNGAIIFFPSKLIESSMKVLLESSKKGPKIAAEALISMAQYVKEIHRVDERLKDLLAEIISSMKSQISFLTPAIAGIVIGITSMITFILGRLSSQLASITGTDVAVGGGGLTSIVSLFGLGVPTYFFQIIVGLYVVQITFILTQLSNNIENGFDKLNERYLLGKNLINSTLLYVILAGAVMLLFNFIAVNIMSRTLI